MNLGKHRDKILWFAVGVIVMLAISFWAIYLNQPKQFNCERAANVCDFASGGGGSFGGGGSTSGGYSCGSPTPALYRETVTVTPVAGCDTSCVGFCSLGTAMGRCGYVDGSCMCVAST